MMNYPLLLKTILYRANDLFPEKEIVSQCNNRDFRYNYADFFQRTCRLANALKELGVKKGDKVGTFAWNTHRHMELYFAIACSGAILHTINIRLFKDHLEYIINHAEDKIIFIDEDLLGHIEEIGDRIPTVEQFVIMTDHDNLPQTKLVPALHYEKLLKGSADDFKFPDLDENTPAALAYTSATTGLPKGVIYTHRSTYMHALTLSIPDAIGISERDVILPVVPMFHVFSWGLPFSAVFMGSKLVLPGSNLTPPALCSLLEQERVTLMPGVPTIFVNILQHLENGANYDFSKLRYIINGGAPIASSVIKTFDEKYGIQVRGTYGMTEASPVVLTCPLKSSMDNWDSKRKYEQKVKQGRLLPGLEMKVLNDQGKEVQKDGREMGELILKGPWIADGYYHDPERSAENFSDGWYHSNDIVTVDKEGYILVQDRQKDLIKSGGEWISSVELENKIMAHPAVLEAAVIAIPDKKWQERPLACVVLKKDEMGVTGPTDIMDFLNGKVARWWLPDKVVFVEEIPKTSVGKYDKKQLRSIYS